ncbi:MAG: response regulator [Deltaproteobacteria bacterium]|nr:response regulator [Deltaproteobacteria bacterium]
MLSSAGEQAPRVLVVDDEKVIREILADFLTLEGFFVRTAEDGAAAMAELDARPYDLVISDLKMPRMGGLELLGHVTRQWPNMVTVIMTGFGTVETAIDAMKRGAYDYVLKPFRIEEVVHIIQRGLEKRRLAAENLRLREAVSLYKVSEAIAASLSLDEVVTTVGDATLQDVGADLALVLLDDGEGRWFERLRRQRVPLDTDTAAIAVDGDLLADYFADQPTLNLSGGRVAAFLREPAEAPPVGAMMAVPLRIRGRTAGYLLALGLSHGRRFDEAQRKLLAAIASRAAAAIENARLYEDLKATFNQTIHGLARTIDMMDRYTAGHSERVAYYARLLAAHLGLGPETLEIVRQAALMHDIGKIGCVMNLNKPGRLSPEEYEVFKRHPTTGKEILEPIRFLHPIIPGVHLHHERWDGKGYPLGLTGKDIPLIARIIAVADTYDAMTSNRSYRRALPHDVAVAEIERCAGSQFDPDCAGPFLGVVEREREEREARGERVPE